MEPRRVASFSPLLANLYMNRLLKYWRITGGVKFSEPG